MKRVSILIILLILTACAAPITATPTAAPSSTPSLTPSATPTATSTPSPTASPTITPTHTPTIEPADGIITFTAFSRNTTLEAYMVRSDGSDFTHLFTIPEEGDTPAWSPDGMRVAFRGALYPPSDTPNEAAIQIMEVDTKTLTLVFKSDMGLADVEWSPDGERLAFNCAALGTGEPMGVFAINIDGSNLMRISEGFDRCPAWSPNGEQIVFRRDAKFIQGRNTFLSHLFVANSNGDMSEYQLTDESLGDAGCPAWSPDGVLIAFNIIIHSKKSAIYTIRPDGSDLQQLTDAANKNSHPTWSPDGSQIAFVSDRDGYDAIYIMNADGSGAMRITDKITGIGRYTLGKLNWLAAEP